MQDFIQNRASHMRVKLMGICPSVVLFNFATNVVAFYKKKHAEVKDHLTIIGNVCHKMLAIIDFL